VVNKADVAPTSAARIAADHPGSVVVSAVSGEGVDDLLVAIADRLRGLRTSVTVLVPYDRGDVVAGLHRAGEVLSETTTDGGMRMRVSMDEKELARFAEFTLEDG
jgi:GTP-binding protein HflX